MGTGMFDRDTLVADEWRLRSVDLIIGPAPDVETLFGALVEAVTEAGLVPHVVRCEDDDDDGYRLHASCDVGTEAVTFERILRILRREESDGSDGCGSPVDRAA
jgi:hypothetical protein